MNHCESLAIWLSRQRRLPYKMRRSLIKKLDPAMLRDYRFEVDFFEQGSGLRFSGNIVNYIDRLIYFCGAHEKYMLTFMRDYVRRLRAQEKRRLSFIDVGANAGNHSIYMSQLVDEVHAFEPYPRVREQLETNLALNRINNIRIYPFGLSNADATQPFYAGPGTNLGAASFVQQHKQDNYYLGDMQLRRGDDVMNEAGIGRIDIMKADVEGYEKFVLEGLKETLNRDRPLIIIELSPTTREMIGGAEAFRALFPKEYDFYYFARGKLDSGRYRLAPFDYQLTPRIQDVIAVPGERRGLL
jgi:FkbM family methyltransferase